MQEVVATVTQAAGGDVALSTELAATILAELEDGATGPRRRSRPVRRKCSS